MGYCRYMFHALPLSCLFKRIFTSAVCGMQVPDGTLTNRRGGGGGLKVNNHFIKNLNEKNSINEYFWGKWRIFTLVIRIRSKIGENLAPYVPAKEPAGKDQTRSCVPQWISRKSYSLFKSFLPLTQQINRSENYHRPKDDPCGQWRATNAGDMQSLSFRTLSNLIVQQLTVLHTFIFKADQPGPSFRF